MTTAGIVLVVASGLLPAFWNLFAKRSMNKTVFLWSFQGVAVVVYPLMRGISPELTPLLGVLALGGMPAVAGLAGRGNGRRLADDVLK